MNLSIRSRFPRSRRTAQRNRMTTLLTVAVAVASAAVYLLDPDHGRRRRGLVRDQATRLTRRVPSAVSVALRDLGNRLRGVAARGRRLLRRQPADDAILEARVRSEMGRVVRHAKAIRVDARDGRIVLSGRVLRDEADRLRATVRSVEGVQEVHDRLDVFDEPGGVPDLQGAGKPVEPRPDFLQTNWSPSTRLIAVFEGATYVALGLYRRGRLGAVLAAGGALVILRGATNIEFRRLLGLGGGRMGIDVEKAIEIDAPVESVFALWSRFEEFPRFMSHVREVRRHGQDRSQWTLSGPAGLPIRFEAVTTRYEPNEMIGWKSVKGEPVRHAGTVRFEPLPENRSRITVRMSYNPPAGVLTHALVSLFGVAPKQALDDDLVRFQSLITHGKATGDQEEAWLEEVAPEAAPWSESPVSIAATGMGEAATGMGEAATGMGEVGGQQERE
jgi:uncharacterized membrane protein/osmotically-inducible protein OsmY